MAGARFELDVADVTAALQQLDGRLGNPVPLYQGIIEYLTRIHRTRFQAQRAPDGTPWQPLSPAYQRRKHRNKNRILVFRGYLQNTLRGQIVSDGLLFGTDRPYGAIHQFGGEIKRKSRTQTLYFNRGRDGAVGNRFVKRKRSNFAQDVNVGESTTRMPARPWLGTSDQDNDHILELALRHLQP